MKKIDIFVGCSFLLLSFFSACVPPSSEEKQTNINAIDFANPSIQKLYNFQDQLLTDSLVPYFKDKDPTLRYLAANAMASVKEPKALVGLETLLKDDVEKVRIAAAYSIGQIGDSTSAPTLIAAFQQFDTIGQFKDFNATILEAIGKCGSQRFLKPLATISTYKNTDTTLLEGQCYAIYRYALRGMTVNEGTQKMIQYATSTRFPSSVRLIAANYLVRANGVTIDSVAASAICSTLASDGDYRLRLALANSLDAASNVTTMYSLISQLGKESDYRVQCALIRTLGKFNYAVVQPVIGTYLRHPNQHVANAAANYYLQNGIEKDAATIYWALAKDTTLHPSTQLMMYQATNRYVSNFMPNTKTYLNAELYRKFNQTNNSQEKIVALRALAEYAWNYKYIKEQGFSVQAPVVRTATVEILGEIVAHPAFYKVFASGAKAVRITLFQYFLDALEVGDVGMVAAAANGLRTPAMGYQYVYGQMKDKTFLTNAQNKLKLPRDIEVWNELQKTIDAFNGITTPTVLEKPTYNQPIDWKLLNSYTQMPKATVQTKYGNFVIEFFKDKAPGSVINFIQLANNGFYNGKGFHRVVTNFVIQGGCPRGDGYGALDYTIRSELPLLHWQEEGLVGMASSGNHTEGTQFFISNAPAFHLDGKYTIFAKVTQGMDVVHKIQAGDVMEKVIIK